MPPLHIISITMAICACSDLLSSNSVFICKSLITTMLARLTLAPSVTTQTSPSLYTDLQCTSDDGVPTPAEVILTVCPSHRFSSRSHHCRCRRSGSAALTLVKPRSRSRFRGRVCHLSSLPAATRSEAACGAGLRRLVFV
ncbi:hypothetical protein BaRGS_00017142 [Batillaria attramentaria]|uniref:Secreted protein n=1 Tax=Batillaria attramentaria TaxID=370345 RepID=A0ABD0KX13_9CAEN